MSFRGQPLHPLLHRSGGFVRSFSFPKLPTPFSLDTKKPLGVFAKDLLLDSFRHIAPLTPATDVVLFRGGIAVKEDRRAHEAILSNMLQEIIKILVSFAVHERPPRTEELLRSEEHTSELQSLRHL